MIRMPRIVIVEDEPDTLLMLRLNLEATGFETSLAADGATAVRRITEEQPDLVLLDLMLPVMDGLQATRKIRETNGTLPIIGLSAHAMQADMDRAREAGCNDYLTKPVDEALLLKVLEKYLG